MEKINIYRKRFSKVNEIELRQDLIVPDSKQDIVKILDANFYCYFSKTDVADGRVKLNGNADSYIIYVSSSEEISNLQTSISFEDIIESNSILSTMDLQYSIKVAKQDIKIINERKISIVVSLEITYEIYGADEIEIFKDFDKIEDIQVNSKKININSLIGVNSNVASIKEEIKPVSGDAILDILKVDTNILNKEIKISYNKVLTKADLEVKIVYLTKDGRVCVTAEKFPVMSFIDLENVKEENFCVTDYQVRNILLNINSDENSISVQMEYEIICKAFENKEQEVACDLYSLKYNTEFSSKEIEVTNDLSQNSLEKVDINEKVELEKASKVIDVFGRSKILNDTEGEVNLKVYYEEENKIGLEIKEFKFPFIAKSTSAQGCSLENVEFDLNGNTLVINASVVMEETNLKKQMINVVQDVTQKEPLSQDDFSMVVYSVKKNDSLWDISKRFKVKQENVITSNGLEDSDSLKSRDKIYIIR